MNSDFKRKIFIGAGLLVLGASLFLLMRGREPEVAIRINTFKMTAEDFRERLYELVTPPVSESIQETFVEDLIVRKLILHEAVERGLDKQPDFLRSVESFWEQSLLKIMVDKKMSELAEEVSIEEELIERYFEAWKKVNPDSEETLEDRRDVIEKKLLRQEQSRAIDEWVEDLKADADIQIDRNAIFDKTGTGTAD